MTDLRKEIEQQQQQHKTYKKWRLSYKIFKGEQRIDSNENLIKGIGEKQENNQEKENEIKSWKKGQRNRGWNRTCIPKEEKSKHWEKTPNHWHYNIKKPFQNRRRPKYKHRKGPMGTTQNNLGQSTLIYKSSKLQ